jgi:hypothetical protein
VAPGDPQSPGSEADDAFEEFGRGRSTHLFRLALVLTGWDKAAAEDVLAALGLTGTGEAIELSDGNLAGPGDLLTARKNEHIIAGEPGRRLTNRDVLQFIAWVSRGRARSAMVRLHAGRDPATGQVSWSAPFELPVTYLREHVQLAYAGNVHVAQSRTVVTAHLVIDETAGRQAFYVGMSRGRERNTAYVVIDRARAADLSAQPRPSPDVADPGVAHGWRPHRLTVLAAVLDREQGDLTGTEVMRRELDRAASLATLAPLWADLTRVCATRRHETAIQALLSPGDWQQFCQDTERGTLARLLRSAELAGHDTESVIRDAVNKRDFAGARSIAAVLHGRIQQIVGTPEPVAGRSYLARTPVIDDPAYRAFAVELAEAMDARVRVLGERAARERPAWALRILGAKYLPIWPGARTGLAAPGSRPPTGKNPAGPARSIRSGPRRSGPRPSCGPAGTPHTPRCACRSWTAKPGQPATVSSWPGGPPTSGRPLGRRRMLRENSVKRTWPKTPAGPVRSLPGIRATPPVTGPSGHWRGSRHSSSARARSKPERAGKHSSRLPKPARHGTRPPSRPGSRRWPPTPNCGAATPASTCRLCTRKRNTAPAPRPTSPGKVTT